MNQIQANIRVLSDDEIARIHNTSMRILSELGLHVPNETVCGMAQKLGAKVDGETVRIPAEALEIALQFAAAGMPLDMTPLVTLAGALAQQNAEVLGSLFIIYAMTGKIARYVGSAHSNDLMHSMMCSFGSPNQALFGIATAQMAAFYGLTSGSNSGLTDALYPDFQAGFEKSFSAVCSVLAGSDAIGGQGIVGADQGFSFAQLVLDDAWPDAFNYTLQGFTVDEDTLGFETIEEVGIGGNLLSEWHTVEYMRASWWRHDLFPRQTFQDGEPIQTARQRAQERAQAIIAENRTDEPVIDGSQCAMLDKIVQDALDHLDA